MCIRKIGSAAGSVVGVVRLGGECLLGPQDLAGCDAMCAC